MVRPPDHRRAPPAGGGPPGHGRGRAPVGADHLGGGLPREGRPRALPRARGRGRHRRGGGRGQPRAVPPLDPAGRHRDRRLRAPLPPGRGDRRPHGGAAHRQPTCTNRRAPAPGRRAPAAWTGALRLRPRSAPRSGRRSAARRPPCARTGPTIPHGCPDRALGNLAGWHGSPAAGSDPCRDRFSGSPDGWTMAPALPLTGGPGAGVRAGSRCSGGGEQRRRRGCRVGGLRAGGPAERRGAAAVVLVEAGPDYPSTAALPADIADGSRPASSHDWGLRASPAGGPIRRAPGWSVAARRPTAASGCAAGPRTTTRGPPLGVRRPAPAVPRRGDRPRLRRRVARHRRPGPGVPRVPVDGPRAVSARVPRRRRAAGTRRRRPQPARRRRGRPAAPQRARRNPDEHRADLPRTRPAPTQPRDPPRHPRRPCRAHRRPRARSPTAHAGNWSKPTR